MEDKNLILKAYYFDLKNPAAYGSTEKLFRVLQKKYPRKFSRAYIRRWLEGVDSYSVSRQVRRRFRTPNVRVTSIDEQFDADLTSVQNISKYNDGVNYLLFIIDIFSRFLWVEPLKDKSAQSILRALKNVFQEGRIPMKFRTDKGSEFVNKQVKKYMRDNLVHFFTTQSQAKANYVERVQRTFKVLLYRYLRKKRNYRYIDDLQTIVSNYNGTPHRSLNYTAPKDVSKSNEADLWAYMYLKKRTVGRQKPKFKFKVGDYVRISYNKEPFRRSYHQQYTTEIFKVKRKYLNQGIPVYKLTDWNGEDIKGDFFNSELTKVDINADSLFFVDKVLKKRKRNGKLQLYVSWEGYPTTMQSWIDATDIREMN